MALAAFLPSAGIILVGKHCETWMHQQGQLGSGSHEVVMDAGSSNIGSWLFGIFGSQSHYCVLDCALLLEGQADHELPEEPLTICHIDRVHLNQFVSKEEKGTQPAYFAPPPVDISPEDASYLGQYIPDLGEYADYTGMSGEWTFPSFEAMVPAILDDGCEGIRPGSPQIRPSIPVAAIIDSHVDGNVQVGTGDGKTGKATWL